ncbi:MAG: hypothetical protein RLW42_16155, partial [Gammaproteobacteria bacterium]
MNSRTTIPCAALRVLLSIPLLYSGAAGAAISAYSDEASFLAALGNLGMPIYREGFESPAWDHVRTTISGGVASAVTVTRLGMTWSANNQSSEITTSSGAARNGSWGVYATPHGSYTAPDPGTDCNIPGDCGDGLRGDAGTRSLLGIGGWFDTNTPFAKLGLFLGSYTGDPADAVIDATIGTTPVFFGMIVPAGFSTVEFRELEGKTEGPFDG